MAACSFLIKNLESYLKPGGRTGRTWLTRMRTWAVSEHLWNCASASQTLEVRQPVDHRSTCSGSAAPVSLFPALEATEAALEAATAANEAIAPPSKKAMSAADKEHRKQARDALRQAKQKHMVELARQARFRANNEMPQAQPAASSGQQARVKHGDSKAVRGHGLIATTVKGRGPLANEASMQQTLESVEAVSSDESPAASS